ncbi:glutamate-1-semialdehyde-2,1-aminomutase [Bacteroidetes/Chlorobi group bacterium Naka2016]|jgi:glutamate-1-semialdehyde 2,1-aminomutase|nr:MAG: glutamate-1-semialdehyde-2,1-aminomutase [Bacteroidetes/Chlorobi group bacterium Naka2016]
MKLDYSEKLFEQAQKFIPGGVNSPVRAFKAVGGTPLFIKRGLGSRIVDVDGNEYIDFVGSWGPHIFGHLPKFVKSALIEQLENGTSFGAPTIQEVRLAQLICEMVPSIEMVRLVNSGTEATMSAIRLARAYTKREKIIKFAGCYHGHFDGFLVSAGSGALTFGVPSSPGVTTSVAKDTLIARYNDIDSVRLLIEENPDQISAIIVEPVAGNMGVVPPKQNFLSNLREICTENNILLIFDEVITGFRLSNGGAQKIYGVLPDLTALGKIIGGGLPVGAFGGKREIMELLAPIGPVYQAGTLSGNPLAVSAGLAVLKFIQDNPTIYTSLEQKASLLEEGIKENLKRLGLNYTLNRVGSMMTLFFTDKEVVDLETAMTSDTNLYAKYFHKMLERGIYLPCSQFEAFFVSYSHTEEDLNYFLKTQFEVLKEVAK